MVSFIVTTLPATAETANANQITTENVYTLQSGMIWNSSIPWNFTNTPAEKLSNAEILGRNREWLNPVVLDGVVYAGANSIIHYGRHWGPQLQWINVYAINEKNGQVIWNYQANYSFNTISNLAVSEGKVFFAADGLSISNVSSAACLIALNATNGSLLWRTPCKVFYSNPATEDGRVFINSCNEHYQWGCTLELYNSQFHAFSDSCQWHSVCDFK
jgi:outer membrane protein assembly factor BamB